MKKNKNCARCNKPLGPFQWGEINGVRYCHTDTPNPTCYMLACWARP